MNEVGTSLTITGLIATIVSVLFAIAALYVSHRRRIQPGGHTLVGNNGTTPDAPQMTARKERAKPATMPFSESVQEREAQPTASRSRQDNTIVSSASGTPLFNRLGARGGMEDPRVKTELDDQYLWE